jgi:hypothetical protein
LHYTQKVEIEKRFFAGLYAIGAYFAEMTTLMPMAWPSHKKAGRRINSMARYSAFELP